MWPFYSLQMKRRTTNNNNNKKSGIIGMYIVLVKT